MKNIILAHYNEDIKWFNNLNFDGNKIVYSKTINNNDKYFIPLNKGQEIPMYLKYIIDYYYDLPEKTLFIHGHQNSLHQDFSTDYIIDNLNWNLDSFFSINKRDWYQEVSKNYEISKGAFDIWLKNNWYIFKNKLEFPIDGLFFYSGAQFVVNKELILQYGIDFYKDLYDWIEKTEIDNVITSRIFEYTWHYIFTKKSIEKKYNNIFNGNNTN
jgi:hypothetical protein